MDYRKIAKEVFFILFPMLSKKFWKDIGIGTGIAPDWEYWEYWDVNGVWTFPHKGHSSSAGIRRNVRNRRSKTLGVTQHRHEGGGVSDYRPPWLDGEFKHLDPIHMSQHGCDKCFDAKYEEESKIRNRKNNIEELLDDVEVETPKEPKVEEPIKEKPKVEPVVEKAPEKEKWKLKL